MDHPEDRGDADANRERGNTEFLEWAAGQTFRFGLIDGRRVRLDEEQQVEGRLALARNIATRAFGTVDAADDWLATPTPDLGGLSPADLIAESDEGGRLALLALVRQHRRMLAAGDG